MKLRISGKVYDFEQGVTLNEVIKKLKLDSSAILVAKVNGVLVDLYTKLNSDADVEFFTFSDEIGKKVFWHSSAHLLAYAVKEIYKDVQLGIGPAIDEGFYYDFYGLKIDENGLKKIEDKMYELAAKGLRFDRQEISVEEAKKIFSSEKFKLELLDEISSPSLYKTGTFVDLCKGPHIPSTSMIKAIKLLRVSGAYWKGDSKREVMTRIYGISFPSKKELEAYLEDLKEREKHDHKLIGKELDLFMMSDLMPGTPIFLPDGAMVYNQLLNFARELDMQHGYHEVITPFIAKSLFWEISGHLEKYKKNMFKVTPFEKEEEEYVLKPMNCPFHILVFKSETRSYKDLPYRISEFGIVHRYELEGTLDGLLRTRVLQQNDAHVFVSEDQIEEECSDMIDMVSTVYKTFNLQAVFALATRPPERIGSDELWDKAESALKNVLEKRGIEYKLKEGDGAFYGPKIDVYVKDYAGRFDPTYAASTIQLDFNLPLRFDVKYIGKDNAEHTPIMIHRAIMGSIGRFMGILLSNTAGELPIWLAPTQVVILPISDKYSDYAARILKSFTGKGIRAKIDSNSTLERRIRAAQMKKIPYMVIVGEKEVEKGKISVRLRSGETVHDVDMKEFETSVLKDIEERNFTASFHNQ